MGPRYNTTELDSDERAALEEMVAQVGVMALCSEIPCRPDTLRRARAGEGLRDHVLSRFQRVLQPLVDRHGMTPSERETLASLIARRVAYRGQTAAEACKTLASFLERTSAQ